MTRITRTLCLALTAVVLLGFSSALFGQIYSFVDENGVKVLTNIAPATTAIRGLKVTGAPDVASNSTKPTKPGGQKVASRNANLKGPVDSGSSRATNASGVKQEPPARIDYSEIIEKYSVEFGVDPALIHSMIETESGFNASAVSPKGAQGLMQLMPATASRLDVANPFDPEENIRGGIKHMRSLLDMFSDRPDSLVLSLAAYNAGENLVQRLGRVPAIRETNDYVRTIIQRYGKRETVLQDPAGVDSESAPGPMPTFRYYDEKGVLVLTNIPPVVSSRGPGVIFR